MTSIAGLQKQVNRLARRVPTTPKEEIDLSLMTAPEQERFRHLYAQCTQTRWFSLNLTPIELEEFRNLGTLLQALEVNDTSAIERYRRRLAHTQEETEALFFGLDIPEDTQLKTYHPGETYQLMKARIREGRAGANQASYLWEWIERFEDPEKAQWHINLFNEVQAMNEYMVNTHDHSRLREFRWKLAELGELRFDQLQAPE